MGIEIGDVFVIRDGNLAVVTELRNESGFITYPVIGMVFRADTLEVVLHTHNGSDEWCWTAQGRYLETGEGVRDLAEKLDDDPRVPIFRALCALEGYSHGN